MLSVQAIYTAIQAHFKISLKDEHNWNISLNPFNWFSKTIPIKPLPETHVTTCIKELLHKIEPYCSQNVTEKNWQLIGKLIKETGNKLLEKEGDDNPMHVIG